ncbi:unnamed protein product [Pylaiella littoralis]
MGVDRRPLKRAPSSDTETATAEVSRAGARIETHCNHPNPSTPPHDRAFCRESSGSRGHGKRGGIDARASGGSRRRSWLNQASYLEVTRSPTYLKGPAGGLVPSPPSTAATTAAAAAAAAAAAGTPKHQQPRSVACSPSPGTVMKSPPAPVRRTGRLTKPRLSGGAGAPSAPLGGGSGSGRGGHGQQHLLLPPPAIQREVSSAFCKGSGNRRRSGGSSGSSGGGGGGDSTGIMVAKRSSSTSHERFAGSQEQKKQEKEEGEAFYFGRRRSGSGDGDGAAGGECGGGPAPHTPGAGHQDPSTSRVECRTPSTGEGVGDRGDGKGHPSRTRGVPACPATPTAMARHPETPGFVSTPGICSPPAPCHRGTVGGGNLRKRSCGSRLSAGVGAGDVGLKESRGLLRAGADDGGWCCCCCCTAAGRSGDGCVCTGGGSSSCSNDGGCREGHHCPSHPQRPDGYNRRRSSGGRSLYPSGAAGKGGAETSLEGGSSAGKRATTIDRQYAHSNRCCCSADNDADGWRGRCMTRKEQLRHASSTESFSSEDPDAGEWGGGAAGGEGCRWRRGGVSRRRGRGARRPLPGRPEETLIDFRGRMAAIASATRLCQVSSSSSAAGTPTGRSSRNANGNTDAKSRVVATPPHPIPRTTSAPILPRRRLLAAPSPSSIAPLPPPAAAPGGGAKSDDNGDDDGDGDAAFSMTNDDHNTGTSLSTTISKKSPEQEGGAGSGGGSGGGGSGWGTDSPFVTDTVTSPSCSAWSSPARRGKARGDAAPGVEGRGAGGGQGIPLLYNRGTPPRSTDGRGGSGSSGWRGRGQGRGRLALDPLMRLKRSERTAPNTRPWPDFEGIIRYEPPESEITTPLRRSDWAVPHGSAMQALASALSEAAGSTACSPPLDVREERRKSIRQRYLERADHFRLIQAARETSTGKGSAMLQVMRQKRQAEEDELRAKQEKEARAAWLKARYICTYSGCLRQRIAILMRMLEGRRRVFLSWARHARASRKGRELLRSREASSRGGVFKAWREEARRSRRVREFVIKFVSGSKRSAFMSWKEASRRSITARKMALFHLQDSQKFCFQTWRDTTRKNVRRRELVLERSALVRSALSSLTGARGRFQRWKAWAGKRAAAKRMARRTREAGLRRCFMALASSQLKLRHRLEERRTVTLAAAVQAWRIGLGRLLRARLLPVTAEGGGKVAIAVAESSKCVAPAPTSSSSGLLLPGWGFAPPEKGEEVAQEETYEEAPPRGEGGGAEEGETGVSVPLEGTDTASPKAGMGTEHHPVLLPPSAFFSSAPSAAASPPPRPSPAEAVAVAEAGTDNGVSAVAAAKAGAAAAAAAAGGGQGVARGSSRSRLWSRSRQRRRKEQQQRQEGEGEEETEGGVGTRMASTSAH